jgi:hypothetical protein
MGASARDLSIFGGCAGSTRPGTVLPAKVALRSDRTHNVRHIFSPLDIFGLYITNLPNP